MEEADLFLSSDCVFRYAGGWLVAVNQLARTNCNLAFLILVSRRMPESVRLAIEMIASLALPKFDIP